MFYIQYRTENIIMKKITMRFISNTYMFIYFKYNFHNFRYNSSYFKCKFTYFEYKFIHFKFKSNYFKYKSTYLKYKFNYFKYKSNYFKYKSTYFKYNCTYFKYKFNYLKYKSNYFKYNSNYFKYQFNYFKYKSNCLKLKVKRCSEACGRHRPRPSIDIRPDTAVSASFHLRPTRCFTMYSIHNTIPLFSHFAWRKHCHNQGGGISSFEWNQLKPRRGSTPTPPLLAQCQSSIIIDNLEL